LVHVPPEAMVIEKHTLNTVHSNRYSGLCSKHKSGGKSTPCSHNINMHSEGTNELHV